MKLRNGFAPGSRERKNLVRFQQAYLRAPFRTIARCVAADEVPQAPALASNQPLQSNDLEQFEERLLHVVEFFEASSP